MGDSPEWVKSKKRRKQGLRGAQAAVTKRWSYKVEKRLKKSFFFRKKIKITPKNIFFLHISSSYAEIFGEKLFRTWEIPRSGSKAKNGEKEREKERERD